jgi:hypothetical protein
MRFQYIGERFTPPDGATIWAAAARPTTFSPSPGLANTVAASHTEHLAVAVSSSMQLLTRGQTGAWDAQVVVKVGSPECLSRRNTDRDALLGPEVRCSCPRVDVLHNHRFRVPRWQDPSSRYAIRRIKSHSHPSIPNIEAETCRR